MAFTIMNTVFFSHRAAGLPHRRDFLRRLTLASALFAAPGAFAAELARTPRQGEGPYYPDHLPLDTDNDLIILNNSLQPAVGEVTYLSGRVLDTRGDPIRDATIEIWQADHNGVYINTNDRHAERDPNFQGFGRFLTGSSGEYLFRTIKPVAYAARTRHIHFAVKSRGRERFTTECYVLGEPKNATDGVLNSIKDPQQRDQLIVPFTPIKDARAGELAAKFDIVLGAMPSA